MRQVPLWSSCRCRLASDSWRPRSTEPQATSDDADALEAAWANIWILEGRRILTPPADGRLLAGVTRGLLIEISGRLGLEAATEPISLSRARRADAVFLTSSLRHAVGAAFDDEPLGEEAQAAIGMIRTGLSDLSWEG